jgi:hypothetical protein
LAHIKLEWEAAGLTRVVIPTTALFTDMNSIMSCPVTFQQTAEVTDPVASEMLNYNTDHPKDQTVAGESRTYQIQARDRYGNPARDVSDPISVQLNRCTNNCVFLQPINNSNGIYLAIFTPTVIGLFPLETWLEVEGV